MNIYQSGVHHTGGDMELLSNARVRECVKPSGATVFHGECEWYPGQLEDELVMGAWQVGHQT